jgi:maltose alpha-D-glucosyltransferase/alpha-amylase
MVGPYVVEFLHRISTTGGAANEQEHLLSFCQRLGKRTAELHRALASETNDPDFAPEAVSQAFLEHWLETISTEVETSCRNLARFRSDNATKELSIVEQLLNRRGELLARVEELVPKHCGAHRIRIHGDYHLGQTLAAQQDDLSWISRENR